MKTKCITILALMVIMSVFLLPLTVLANDDEDDDYTETVADDDTEPDEGLPPIQSPWAGTITSGNPFTPDGVATVIDNATGDDGKEFFTFQTPAGNVFFLIIDRSRGHDNVYFLNAVTEDDLIALAQGANNTVFSPQLPPKQAQPNPDVSDENGSLEIPETEEQNNGTLIFIVIAAAVFAGAAYYIKIVRPKKQDDFDDDEEYEGEEEKLEVPTGHVLIDTETGEVFDEM